MLYFPKLFSQNYLNYICAGNIAEIRTNMRKFLKIIFLIGLCYSSLYMTINLLGKENKAYSVSTQLQQENLHKDLTTKQFFSIINKQIPFDVILQEQETTSGNNVIRLKRNKNLIDLTSDFTWVKNNLLFLKSFLQPYNHSINVYFKRVTLYYIFALLKIIV